MADDGLYPVGYGDNLVNLEQLMAWAREDLMEPGYARRLRAYLQSESGEIGIGGAVRFVQPDKNGFAPDGMSFHQLQHFVDGLRMFMAVDLVHRNPGNKHRAPTWAEVPRQGSGHPKIALYGVHCNVNGEPWHMQCIEVDGWQGWVNAGRRHPDPRYPLPTDFDPVQDNPPGDVIPPPPPSPPANPTYPVPPGSFTVPTLTSLRQGAPNNPAHVQVMQAMLNRWVGYGYNGPVLVEDGDFGGNTDSALRNFQRSKGLSADGLCGPVTWAALYSDC